MARAIAAIVWSRGKSKRIIEVSAQSYVTKSILAIVHQYICNGDRINKALFPGLFEFSITVSQIKYMCMYILI